MSTRLGWALVAAAVTGALALAAPARAADPPHGKLKAMMLEGVARLPVEAIKAQGLDKKHGFDLEYDIGLTPTALYTAINAKKVDVSHGVWSTLAKFRTQGTDVLMVAAITKMNHDVLVPVNSPVKGLGDLKGKRVGIFGGPPGGVTITLRFLLQRFYQTDLLKDARVHFAAEPNLFALAERGDLDVVLSLDPNATKQLLTGRYRSIGSLGEEWERRFGHPNTSSALVTFESLVKARPQAVQAFMNAYRDARLSLLGDESLPTWRRACERVAIQGEDGCQLYIKRARKILIFEWGKEYIDQLRKFADVGMETLGKDFLPRFPDEAFSTQFSVR